MPCEYGLTGQHSGSAGLHAIVLVAWFTRQAKRVAQPLRLLTGTGLIAALMHCGFFAADCAWPSVETMLDGYFEQGLRRFRARLASVTCWQISLGAIATYIISATESSMKTVKVVLVKVVTLVSMLLIYWCWGVLHKASHADGVRNHRLVSHLGIIISVLLYFRRQDLEFLRLLFSSSHLCC